MLQDLLLQTGFKLSKVRVPLHVRCPAQQHKKSFWDINHPHFKGAHKRFQLVAWFKKIICNVVFGYFLTCIYLKWKVTQAKDSILHIMPAGDEKYFEVTDDLQ